MEENLKVIFVPTKHWVIALNKRRQLNSFIIEDPVFL